MVKTHTTTSSQYTYTLPLQRGIHVAHLRSSTNRPDGEKYQSPWLEREGWSAVVKAHTTRYPQYTYTLPLEGGIGVAQLRSSTDNPNGEKYQSPRLEGEECRSLVKTHTTTSPKYTFSLPFEGGICVAQLRSSTDRPNGEKY
jgi:hypothetical protein